MCDIFEKFSQLQGSVLESLMFMLHVYTLSTLYWKYGVRKLTMTYLTVGSVLSDLKISGHLQFKKLGIGSIGRMPLSILPIDPILYPLSYQFHTV